MQIGTKKVKLNYILIPLTAVIAAYLGALFTGMGMNWYSTLEHPRIIPPNYVFGLVWNFIYVCTVASALIIWNKGKDRGACSVIMTVFLINAILNVLWSYLFFVSHQIEIAIYETAVLELTLFFLIFESRKISKVASLLLVPYFVWVGFAIYLAHQFMILNV